MDFEKLREDLKDYFGTAMSYNPMAVIELSEVEHATEDKLISIAIKNGFDLSEFEDKKMR